MREYKSLVVFIVLTGAAALVGSQFLPGEWYTALEKPFFNPPNWVFAPVWSVLYIMMAVAAGGYGVASASTLQLCCG